MLNVIHEAKKTDIGKISFSVQAYEAESLDALSIVLIVIGSLAFLVIWSVLIKCCLRPFKQHKNRNLNINAEAKRWMHQMFTIWVCLNQQKNEGKLNQITLYIFQISFSESTLLSDENSTVNLVL